MSPDRLESIDFLRGAAAVMVVLHHSMIPSGQPPQDQWFQALLHVSTLGAFGVPLFFTISGFCIHLKWSKLALAAEPENVRIDFGAFWRRRFWRLYPPYLVVLCLSMGLMLAAYLAGKDVYLLTTYPGDKLRWMGYDFLAHLFMLHGFHPVLDTNGGNPAFWSLAREEYLYLLYFAFLFVRRRASVVRTNAYVLAVSLVFPLTVTYFLPSDSPWVKLVGSSALALWFQWTLGAISVEAFLGLITLPRWASSGFSIAGWGVLAYLNHFYVEAWIVGNCVWAMLFFTIVNFCIRREQIKPSDSLVYHWFARVGIWSYSLYLIHIPVQAVVRYLLRLKGAELGAGAYIALSLFLIVVSLAAGKAFFYLIERRFIR